MTVTISAERLTEFARTLLQAWGSEKAEAAIVAEHLVLANLSGHDSHGAGMLPIYDQHLRTGGVVPNTGVRLMKDGGAILAFDGAKGFGQRVALEAIDQAIARARETGLVAMTVGNAHHIGRVGHYGERATAAGLISIHFVNVIGHAPVVAPHRGTDGRFTTNPVCIAVPRRGETPPVLLDFATSKVAMGKVRVAMNKGEELADGLVIDASGRPTRNPRVMFSEPRGALLPLAEHKGYGLAVMCELLGGALSGFGATGPAPAAPETTINNMLTILLDPARFADADWYDREVAAYCDFVKASPPADPDLPVLVAGEPEVAMREERRRNGIPVDDTTWGELCTLAETAGISGPVAA